MAETIRFSLIGREDLRRGTSTFEVTLADGRVVTLNEIDITAFTAKGNDIASAAELTIPSGISTYHDITGTTTVTSISTKAAGFILTLQFDGILTLTHNATTLILQGNTNYTTAAGDVLQFISEGDGNWRELSRRLDSGSFAVLGANTFTGTQRWDKGADIASAAELTLTTDGNFFDVTGTTTVTSISTAAIGTIIRFQFDGALLLTHNATSLILRGGRNYTTVAGDLFTFISEGSGNWREVSRSNIITAESLSGIEIITKASDETVNNSSTLQDDDDFAFSLAASEVVHILAFLNLDTAATPDWKCNWSLPASGTLTYHSLGGKNSIDYNVAAGDLTANGQGAGTKDNVIYSAMITNSTTAGTATFQWAQNTANASDTKITARSFMVIYRV